MALAELGALGRLHRRLGGVAARAEHLQVLAAVVLGLGVRHDVVELLHVRWHRAALEGATRRGLAVFDLQAREHRSNADVVLLAGHGWKHPGAKIVVALQAPHELRHRTVSVFVTKRTESKRSF